MTEEQICKLLWRIDPMHTCCNVNDNMEDEYSKEARWISDLVNSGMDARKAVITVFDIWFEEGCMEGGREIYLEEIVRALEGDTHEPR